MSNGWLSGLNKLVELGNLYVRHVEMARAAAGLPERHRHGQLHEYLNSLTPGEFAGFQVAVVLEANRETDPAVKEALAWISSHVDYLRTASPEEVMMAADEEVEALPAADNEAAFDQSLNLVDQWHKVPWAVAEPRLQAHVASLTDGEFEQFIGHVQRMIDNVTENLTRTKERESNAWGGFVEDRLAYSLAKLRTGARDPECDRQIREYEELQQYARTLLETAIAYRMFLKAQEQSPQESTPSPPSAAARDIPPLAPDGSNLDEVFEHIEALRQEELAAGRLRGDRDFSTATWLGEFKAVLQARQSGRLTPAQTVEAIRALATKRRELVVEAGPDLTARLPEDSRARVLLQHAESIKSFAYGELANIPAGQTMAAFQSLFNSVGSARQQISTLTEDAAAVEFERNELRPLAQQAHDLALLRHLVLAEPAWDCPPATALANRIFYAGAADLKPLLGKLASAKRLDFGQAQRRSRYYGQARWDDLRASFVCVFDWRSYTRDLAVRAPEAAAALASTAYELGLALALGKPVVIIARTPDRLPFDIDLTPLCLTGEAPQDAEALGLALDQAFYERQRLPGDSTLPDTLEQLERIAGESSRRKVFEKMGWLDPDSVRDPALFLANARQVAAQLGRNQLLTPAWPTSYPAPDNPVLFHVAPFSLPWSAEARRTVKQSCQEAGVAHADGQTAKDARILHRIWRGIGAAHWVLVDLTDLNPNVLVELGFAHALGRPVLLVQQLAPAQSQPVKVRNLEKIEVLSYANFEELRQMICRWVEHGKAY